MSSQQECAHCHFAHFAKGQDGKIVFTHKVCKRYPPKPMALPAPAPVGIQVQGMWPIVGAGEWCGEFQKRGDMMAIPGSRSLDDAEVPEKPQ